MKAISLWQPWASLIATGAKRFETRSWSTRYRGPLLICASMKKVPTIYYREIFQQAWVAEALRPVHIPFGEAVCVVDLVACIRTETMSPEQIGTDEFVGNFSPGRFAWKMENVRTFFEVDDSVIEGR